VPALQSDRSNPVRRVFIADAFHVDPLFGQRMNPDRIRDSFGPGVRNRTGYFAGPAGKAFFYDAINAFHRYFLK